MGFLRRSNKRSSAGGAASKRASSSAGGGGDAVATDTDSLATLSRGDAVWVRAGQDVWLPGVLDAVTKTGATVTLADGMRATHTPADVLPANPPAAATAHDVTHLSHLNEPAVLHGLAVRHAEDEVYTRAGPVLVAVNPFKAVPRLYDEEAASRYGRAVATEPAASSSPPPHIFQTAAVAYDAIARKRESVSIVINGESGAGKTETAKLAMRHVTRLAGGTGVESAVLASNPLLEAFGNAKTSRNANSSRFGKLVTLRFDAAARVAGARIQTFLLEKSRVAARPEGERSLHIFYQLVAGVDDELRNDLALLSAADAGTHFAYLASGPMTVDGVDDAAAWCETRAALAAVGVNDDDAHALFRLVAACLHLGNLTFDGVDDGEGAVVSPGSNVALNHAARLLGVDAPALAASLITRALTVGSGDAVTKRLRPDGAAGARDALAKAVYACAFDWLVGRVNAALSGEGENEDADTTTTTPELAILDIYGFECFADNGFEQLAINTANEHLQAQFNGVMLAAEQDEYATEGVDWTRVEWRDNLATLAALDARPPHGVGVLALLDEACVVPGGSDAGFGLRVASALASSPSIVGCPRGAGDTFAVDHAAGVVTYTTAGFLARNRDVVPVDAVVLLSSSTAPLAQSLAASAAALASRRGATVMASFRDQLRSLIAKLDATDLHFVRCIKPNDCAAPSHFDGPLVAHQLRCAGVTEVARIARTGYPSRVAYGELASRFGVLVGGGTADNDARKTALAVLAAVGVPSTAWQAGRTKLFLRAGVLAALESALSRADSASSTIGAAWRGARDHAAFQRARAACVTLQAAERRRVARGRWIKVRAAAVVIQRAHRSSVAVRKAKRELEALRVEARAAAEAEGAAAAAEAERQAAAEAAAAAEAEREAVASSEPTLTPPLTSAVVVDPGDGWRVRAPAGFIPAGSPPPRTAAPAARGAPPRRVSAAGSAPPQPLETSHEVALWAAYADRLEAQVAQLIAHNRGLHGALAAVRSDLAAVVAAGSSTSRGRRGAATPATAPVPPSERSAAAAHAAALRTINELGTELGRKADAFVDDAAFLTEVATGQADAPAMHAAAELATLRTRFDAFAADFGRRMAGAEDAVLGPERAAALRRERTGAKVGDGAIAKPASAGRGKVLGLVARAGGV